MTSTRNSTRNRKLAVVAGTVAALGVTTTAPGSAAPTVGHTQNTSARASSFHVAVPGLGPSGTLGNLTFCDSAAADRPGFDSKGCRTTVIAADTDNRLQLWVDDPADTYTVHAAPWDPTIHAGLCGPGTTAGFVFQAVAVGQAARVRALHDGEPRDYDHDNDNATPKEPLYDGSQETYYPGKDTWYGPDSTNRSPGFALCVDLS